VVRFFSIYSCVLAVRYTCGIGIGPTKMLARLANYMDRNAERDGVLQPCIRKAAKAGQGVLLPMGLL
jgi:hypothetical protein